METCPNCINLVATAWFNELRWNCEMINKKKFDHDQLEIITEEIAKELDNQNQCDENS